MNHFQVNPIGTIHHSEEGPCIRVDNAYIPALKALEGFSHINVIWWFDRLDDEKSHSLLQTEQPYKGAPAVMGIFATRSPQRPNPLALTASQVTGLDPEAGIIRLAFIDAKENTPVLDIKPYTPSFDRIEHPGVPAWCSHWPRSSEESAEFDWDEVFS